MRSDIQQTLIDGVKGRMSRSRVSQDIFDRMVGHNRDFQRIADTEIQNAINNANVREIVNETPLGKPVYLKRIEIVDSNTCAYCKRMNGVVAKWSDVPLESDRIKDAHASYALWEGKEWNGKGHNFSIGVFHPYCRGTWVKYSEDDRITDGYVASIFGRGKKWKEAVETAKKEYKEKGIESPDDTTQGYTERINELMNEEVKKAFPTLEIESIEKSGVPVGYISGNYKKISDNPSKWAWIPKEKLKKEIYDFARKHYQGKQYYNSNLGENILVVKQLFKEWMSKTKSKEQALALMKLPEMIKNAVKTGSAEDKHKNKKIFEVAYMRSRIKSNDKNCVAIMTVKRYVDKKNNLYHFYLDDIDFK